MSGEHHDEDPGHLANVRPPDWKNPVPPAGGYHLVVVGAGPAGLTAARGAAMLGVRVALIERHWLGGESLNWGSVPTKTLWRTSRLYAQMRDADWFGAAPPEPGPRDPRLAKERALRVRRRIGHSESALRLATLGIDVYFGQARFTGARTIAVDGAALPFRKAIVATGSRPRPVDIPGLEDAGYWQASSIFDHEELPASILVIGGGANGCEGAQALARMGVQTTIAMSEPMFLPGEERDAAMMISDALGRDGVSIRLNTTARSVRMENGKKVVELVNDGDVSTVAVEQIFVGLGREAAVDGLDLERAGIACQDDGRGPVVDDTLRTTNKRVYAVGDCCLPNRTSIAIASARIALGNALLWRRRRFSDVVVPWCTYTDPEIAHVGMYVRQAREQGIPVRTLTVPMHEVDRAIADGEETGFVKIHIKDGSDRILGATIVAPHAGEMINEIALAIVAGIGLRTVQKVLRAYPTQAEAIRLAADRYVIGRAGPLLRWAMRMWAMR